MDAADYVTQSIKAHPVVFLAEQHTTVNPVVFLASNLPRLYAVGLRYLFLEGGLPTLPSESHYRVQMFYPWTSAGWKFEWLQLAEAVREINARAADGEKLAVLIAEEGNPFDETTDPNLIPELLNGRDSFASSRIMNILNGARPRSKALVFYGAGHGSRAAWPKVQTDGSPPFTWKPLGTYLSERLGQDFESIGFDYADLPELRDSAKAIPFEELRKRGLVENSGPRRYDAEIFERTPIYGVFYDYVPTDENLRFMLGALRSIEARGGIDSSAARYLPTSEKGRSLLYIYYLKLYFGDHFDYRLWGGNKPLATALSELEAYAFAPGAQPSARIVVPQLPMASLREYHGLMAGVAHLPSLPKKILAGQTVPNLMRAHEIFPEDIWPLFWLARARTILGDYAEATRLWAELLALPLSSCAENLPTISRYAADCARAMGAADRAAELDRSAAALTNEHSLDTSGSMAFEDIK
ncbi:MAG: hypothetical protein ACHQ2Z_11670 [Elusimicrobiota bacterium]